MSLKEAGFDIKMCRSMTMDGAGNMAGKQMGCAARFLHLSPKAIYHYCSSHDLNLALCKSCQIKEVSLMLDALTQLGIFFKYLLKRSRCLEEAIKKANKGKSREKQTKKLKIGLFCETRWVEKQNNLVIFDEMFQAITGCLKTISSAPSSQWAHVCCINVGLTSKFDVDNVLKRCWICKLDRRQNVDVRSTLPFRRRQCEESFLVA